MALKRSRYVLTLIVVVLIGTGLFLAFQPQPMMVDTGVVSYSPMVDTIDEEGRTRVHNTYVVSTPFAGRMLRVDVEPGDHVTVGESIVAHMMPSNPDALDSRSREQARAAVSAAEAALRAAQAELNKAIADKELASSELDRARQLKSRDAITQTELDQAVRAERAADATVQTAEATIDIREAELANERARLISFNQQTLPTYSSELAEGEALVYAPISGQVLRVLQRSETTLSVGTPILEIGNIENDLEIVVELLSTDAVQVTRGQRVIVEDWGGINSLKGVVKHVEPWGFTKYSALGVEEQRVNAIVRFTDPFLKQTGLGHGFRVETRIVVWEDDNALTVPSSALFRDGASWAVFVVKDGFATQRKVEIGRNNGVQAQVIQGLEDGERVVLYPSSGLVNQTAVTQRPTD